MGGMIYGASGVCMGCMRRYGSVWLVVSDEVVFVCRTTSLQDDPSAGRYACMSCLLGGGWNKHVYNIYTFTARLLGC